MQLNSRLPGALGRVGRAVTPQQGLGVLPSLPLPAGARIAAVGDSQIAFNTFQFGPAPAEGVSNNALGFLTHARGLDARFLFENWYDGADPTGRNIAGGNQGVMSDLVDAIVSRLPPVLARRPDALILEGGTNTISFGADQSAAFVISQLDQGLRMIRQAGTWALLMTIFPRVSWSGGLDPVREQTRLDVNTWIRAQAGRDGVMAVVDGETLLAPGGVIDQSLYQGDGVHLGMKGAPEFASQVFVPIVQANILPGSVFNMDPAVGNLMGAGPGNMAGTGGVISGVGVSGAAPTGFTISLDRNASTIVVSKEVVSGAVQGIVLDITPADLNASFYGGVSIRPAAVVAPPLVPGDWVQAFFFIETNGVEAFSMARLELAVRQGTTVRARTYGHNASSGNFSISSKSGRSFWLMTEPLRVPEAAFDRIYSDLALYWDKTRPAFRAKVNRPILRKVPDPRPGWGYA